MRSRLATRLSRPGIRFRALRWPARIALLLLTGITALAVFGPLLAPDPLATGVPAQPPSTGSAPTAPGGTSSPVSWPARATRW